MKILVVDDSTINNILLQSFLEDNNFQVITALNVPDAFDVLIKDNIELVLLDLMMPDFSGFDFLII
jgi:DNA-binding response OmpR family regulator